MQAYQAPEYDMRARYPFDLTIRLHGDMSRVPVGSPTHPIRVIAATDLLTVSLAAPGMLDRDFVLTLNWTFARANETSVAAQQRHRDLCHSGISA